MIKRCEDEVVCEARGAMAVVKGVWMFEVMGESLGYEGD